MILENILHNFNKNKRFFLIITVHLPFKILTLSKCILSILLDSLSVPYHYMGKHHTNVLWMSNIMCVKS